MRTNKFTIEIPMNMLKALDAEKVDTHLNGAICKEMWKQNPD